MSDRPTSTTPRGLAAKALVLRDLVGSRPASTFKAILLHAVDLTRRLRPTTKRTVTGPRGRIELARDRFGVPGVFAESELDLAFGMGWACAEDRFFQMDLVRRAFTGHLAEAYGDRRADRRSVGGLRLGGSLVELDAFARSIGFRAAAERSLSVASPRARAFCEAYATGVNAWLDTGRRPWEMLATLVEPQAWTAVDCFLVAKAMAFQMTFTYRLALSLALNRSTLASAGDPEASGSTLSALDEERARSLAPRLLSALDASDGLREVLGGDGQSLGSNAFAIAPSRSELGVAMLAADPHLPTSAPGPLWEVRLSGRGLDVRGAGHPGLPVLPFGQNNHGAWAVTAGWGDDSQVYREDLAQLRAKGRLEEWDESIAVRDQPARVLRLARSPRGPILPADLVGDSPEVAIALRWSGTEATLDIDAGLALFEAHDVASFRAATALHGGPTLDFVWADRDGHIARQFAGKVPRRAGQLDDPRAEVDGLTLLDGEDPRGAWQGWVPFESLPHQIDPEGGIIVSANHCPYGPSDPELVGRWFQPPYRAARIFELLSKKARYQPEDLASIQLDLDSRWARACRDALLGEIDDAELALEPTRGKDVVALARRWDGQAEQDSAGAAATYVLLDCTLRHVFFEDLGEVAFERYFELINAGTLAFLDTLRDPNSPWLRGRDRATLVRDAAAMAEGRLRRRLGPEPSQWRWGALHRVTFRHPLDGSFGEVFRYDLGLRSIASPGSFPCSGDGTTVNIGEYDLGGLHDVRVAAALRWVMVAGRPWSSRGVLVPGQSGDPTSRHYRDQVPLWLSGSLRSASWSHETFASSSTTFEPPDAPSPTWSR